MTKEITLTRGMVAIVDDGDYDKVSKFNWYAHNGKSDDTWYARRASRVGEPRGGIMLHRFILGTPIGTLVDHKDGNGLNCTRDNMRECVQIQNAKNRKVSKNSTSGYKGVYWEKDRKKWYVQIMSDGKRYRVGWFKIKEDAIRAYAEASKRLFGEFNRSK